MRGLSEPAERTASHCRTIECRGYARSDGLLDIEAQLIDVKEYDFPSATHGTVKAREPFHHMQVRVTVNSELQIIAAEGPKPTYFKPLVQSFPVREVIVDAASASPELILVSASQGIHLVA